MSEKRNDFQEIKGLKLNFDVMLFKNILVPWDVCLTLLSEKIEYTQQISV